MAADPLGAIESIPGVLSRRVNADPERVEKGLAQLVLTVVELLRQLRSGEYDVLVGLVDRYAGSVEVRHERRTEVFDAVGSE